LETGKRGNFPQVFAKVISIYFQIKPPNLCGECLQELLILQHVESSNAFFGLGNDRTAATIKAQLHLSLLLAWLLSWEGVFSGLVSFRKTLHGSITVTQLVFNHISYLLHIRIYLFI